MQSTNWAPEHCEALRENLAKGMSYSEIAEAINDVVSPRGVGVVVEGRHLCIEMRGVEKESSETVTSCMLGVFRSDKRTRAEFLSHLHTNP